MQVTRFSLVDFLYKNANRLSAYKEERAPRQAEKETRFSILCGQLSEKNANKLRDYRDEQEPQMPRQAKMETRFCATF
jgi:hypothetical protein